MFSTFDLCLLLYVIRLAGWLKHCNLSLSLSSKSPTQSQAKKSGLGSASKTDDRPVTRNNGVRSAAPVSTKSDRQLDKRSLDQPSEPLQKAYAKIDEQQKSLEQRLQKMSEDNK